MNLIKWIVCIVFAIISMAYIYHFDDASKTIIGCIAALGYALYEINKSMEKNHKISMQKIEELHRLLISGQVSEPYEESIQVDSEKRAVTVQPAQLN
ncbi:MAG: hypothetical protein V4713_01890 [Pseudomonadota bacterium]